MSFVSSSYDTYFTNFNTGGIALYVPPAPNPFSDPFAFRTVHWGDNSVRYFTPDPVEIFPAYGCYSSPGFGTIDSSNYFTEPIVQKPLLPPPDITKSRLYRRRMLDKYRRRMLDKYR